MRLTPSSVARVIFQEKNKYKDLDDKDKEQMFFKINQYMSRLFPYNADNLNKKNIPKDLALDVWFNAMQGKTFIPHGFFPDWNNIKKEPNAKKTKTKEPELIKITNKKKK